MGLRTPLLGSLELLARKAVPWAQGLSPPPLRSLLILWGPQDYGNNMPSVVGRTKAALCFCDLLVYPFMLCRKNQRLLYWSLPTSFQEEPALLRQLPEGGLEA